MERQCNVCKEIKPITEFYKKPNNKGVYYYQHKCKKCVYQYKVSLIKKDPLSSIKRYKHGKAYKINLQQRIQKETGYLITYNQIKQYGLDNVIEVFKNDNGQCRICKSQIRLNIHHLDHKGRAVVPKPNNHPSNLILLCPKCHTRIHTNKLLLN